MNISEVGWLLISCEILRTAALCIMAFAIVSIAWDAARFYRLSLATIRALLSR